MPISDNHPTYNYDTFWELEKLRQWKAEAMVVIAGWEKVWEAAGCPGPLGGIKSESLLPLVRLGQAVEAVNGRWKWYMDADLAEQFRDAIYAEAERDKP